MPHVTPDFTSENGETAQGVPTIVAGITRALTLGFPPAEVGMEGARVRVASLIVDDAQKAVLRARTAMNVLMYSGDSAAYKRAQAAYDRRRNELKQAAARTMDAYGVALDEDNVPYVMEERFPALLAKHPVGSATLNVRTITGRGATLSAAA